MKKLNNSIIALGVMLVIAAAILTAYNIYTIKDAGEHSDRIASEINDVIPSETESSPDYQLNPEMEMPRSKFDSYDCVGKLEIPALRLTLPIIGDCTKANLKVAPCLYSGSAYTDNMVIAGHNYNTHFRNIGKLKQGDEIIFTDMDGNEFRYIVDATENLQPTDIEDMISGEWPLTLFTCNSSGSLRVTVRCDLK